jgi:hypothetical protein
MEAVGVIVGVAVAVALAVADGSAVRVAVGSGVAATSPPQAVKNIDTIKVKRISLFMILMEL